MQQQDVLSETTRLMEHARQLYRDLTEELIGAIDRLKADQSDTDVKARSETIRAHRKALQTILELEVQFLKQAEKGRDAHELDLEAAREEVMGRFRRLAESGED